MRQLVNLTTREVHILEGLRKGQTIAEICDQYGYIKTTVASRIHFFLARGYIKKTGRSKYDVLLKKKGYYTNDKLNRSGKLKESTARAKLNAGIIPDHIQTYLRENYNNMPRSMLSRELGLPRYILNNYLIEMRLGS